MMLDQLVESKDYGNENRRRGSFLLSTFLMMACVLTFGLVYSLFNHAMAMENEGLDVSTLVAPVALSAEIPPEEVAPPKQQTTEREVSKLIVRQDNIRRMDETPVEPLETVSTTPSTKLSRPASPFKIGGVDSPDGVNSNGRGERAGDGNNQPITVKPPSILINDKEEQPPSIKQKPKPEPKAETRIVSKGVINGQAKNLVVPPYPAPARAVGAQGEVRVQVVIDEEGNVISANAVSGHPLLKSVAQTAARSSKFSPTYLNEQKVKVNGFIVYSFKAQ